VNVDGLRLRTSLAVGAVGQSRIPKAGAFACNHGAVGQQIGEYVRQR